VSETARNISEAVVTSVVQQKTPHLINTGVMSTAIVIEATSPQAVGMMDWLPMVAVTASICVSVAYFVKAYLDIKLVRIEIAIKSRRSTDKG